MRVRAAHRKRFHSFWERRQHVLICATPAYVCVCAGKSPIPTEPLKQRFLTCKYTHSRWQQHISTKHNNLTSTFFSLVLGIRPSRPDPYNTHVCVHGRAKMLSQFLSEKTYPLSCLHEGAHDLSTKLMFTDVTVARLPRF